MLGFIEMTCGIELSINVGSRPQGRPDRDHVVHVVIVLDFSDQTRWIWIGRGVKAQRTPVGAGALPSSDLIAGLIVGPVIPILYDVVDRDLALTILTNH